MKIRLVNKISVLAILLFINSLANAQNLGQLLDNLYGPNHETTSAQAAPSWTPQIAEPTVSTYQSDPRFNAQLSESIATNVLEFAHEISRTVLRESTAKSEVFSPISIYSCLSLVLLGAKGKTFDELLSVMRLDKDHYLAQNPWKIHEEMGILLDDLTRNSLNPYHQRSQHNWKVNRGPVSSAYRNELSDYKISVANGLFVQTGYSLRPDYRSSVLGTYKSNMQNLDFHNDLTGSVNYINSWVNQKTEGLIPEIVNEQLDRQTRLVLASAIYYNAMWANTFIESITGPKKFYPDGLSGPSVTVQMMGNGGMFPHYESKEFDCQILGLPYKHNLTTMFIILPNNSSRSRLRQMQEYLTADKIESMISKMEWKTTILLLPRMHIMNELKMKEVFLKMGLSDLFDPLQSDLSLISNGFGAEPEAPAGHTFFAPPPLQGPIQNQFVASFTGFDDEESPFIFSRHGEDDEEEAAAAASDSTTTETSRSRRSVSYKVPSEGKPKDSPLRLKDYLISKRIIKSNPGKKNVRSKRQVDLSQSLKQLDSLRDQLRSVNSNPGLFAEDVVHKVNLTINEKGTEGGAATFTTLFRSGTDVVMRAETPFMFLIRHDDTKLPLFYGTVYDPSP